MRRFFLIAATSWSGRSTPKSSQLMSWIRFTSTGRGHAVSIGIGVVSAGEDFF
jgi:hypothetical protein